MAANQQQNNSGYQFARNTAKDAAAVAKIASQAASGNVAGAAVTALKNPQTVKRVLCGILAFHMLLLMCICAVPHMVWESAEQTFGMIADNAKAVAGGAEDAWESMVDYRYYFFYGSSDGHEGLTGILTALPRAVDRLMDIVKIGWSFLSGDEISGVSKDTQDLVEKLYSDDKGQDNYYTEAKAGGSKLAMDLAYAQKRQATSLRIEGRVSDIQKSIEKDFEKQCERANRDENFLNVSRDSISRELVNALMALYTVQTGGSLETSTLAEYNNWLGRSNQTIFESGLFDHKKYGEIPRPMDGEGYGAGEVDWLTKVYHWGGELLPQDVYEEYNRLAQAAVDVESRVDFHYTKSDRYATRSKVMNGKYTMRTPQELDKHRAAYPDYCTPQAYRENYSQVWYNDDANSYYDRGVLDVMLYPDPAIKVEYKTRTIKHADGSTTVITQFFAYYTIRSVSVVNDGDWDPEAEKIFKDVLRLTGELRPIDTEQTGGSGSNGSPEIESGSDSNAEGNGYTIKPRAVLLNSPTGSGNAKTSNIERENPYQLEYFSDLLEVTNAEFGTYGVGGGGGSGYDLVSIARQEIGVTEQTGSNDSKYNFWYGAVGQPWCAMFVCWCADQCGYLESGLFPKTAHSATFWNHVLANPDKGMLYTPSDVRAGAVTPQAGDILIVSPTNNMEAPSNTTRAPDDGAGTRHVAIVTGYDGGSQRIATIDGNCGNAVIENSYNISTGDNSGRRIWGFVRPNYPSKGQNIPGGEMHEVEGLDIDTDGSTDPNDMKDPYYQPQTSATTVDGKYYDASKVHYVVLAKGQPASKLNCLATIRDLQTGKILNCVAADTGPRADDWNEVSVCTARDLGYTVGGNIGVSKDKRFVITYYPDCKLKLYANNFESINAQIDRQAADYAASKGGDGDYKPNFDASGNENIT